MTKDKLPNNLEARLIKQALEGAQEAEFVHVHPADVRVQRLQAGRK